MNAVIRLATADDAARVADIYAPVVRDTAVSFETVAPTAREIAERIESVSAYAPWLVLVEGPDVLGYAYASQHRARAAYAWSVDVSVYVHADHRARGVGSALYTSLFAALAVQGFCVAHAGITLPNAASVALHESLGFEPVGVYRDVGFKLGAWHDVGWWRRPLRERPASPDPIVGMEAVRDTAAFRDALARGLGAGWFRTAP